MDTFAAMALKLSGNFRFYAEGELVAAVTGESVDVQNADVAFVDFDQLLGFKLV